MKEREGRGVSKSRYRQRPYPQVWKRIFTGFLFSLLWGYFCPALAGETIRYALLPQESRITFQAQSTLGIFSGTTGQIKGEIIAPLHWEEETFPAVQATVRVDPATLDTGISLRNRDMWKLLEVERYPQIVYRLQTVKQRTRDPATGRLVYDTVGTLQIHGVTRSIYTVVEVIRQGETIRISGEKRLRMSGYGITPPTRFLLLRVRDTVTVQFQIVGRQIAGD
ncbi:MAG: YceI family protein [Nitrospinota bacterium]|nr:MAG: YceI family protein [Nitrospinota bacterium]